MQMVRARRSALFVLVLAGALASAAALVPDAIKLSGPLARQSARSVTGHRVGPDGAWVAYRADQDADDSFELYSAPADGSAPPLRISGALASVDVDTQEDFAFAGPGTLVYRSSEHDPETVDLYAVPIDGSAAPVRLSPPPVAGGDVASFTLSPDATRVVYCADQETDGMTEIYSVPLDGSSAAVRLNGPLGANRDVLLSVEISPDSSTVVFRSDALADQTFDLFAAPIDGSGPATRLSAITVANGFVRSFQVTADSSRVVYDARQETHDHLELYSAPLDGSLAPVKLSGAMTVDGNLDSLDPTGAVPQGASFLVAPDGARVVYRADQDTDNDFQLYSAPVDGSAAAVRISTSEGVVGTRFAIAPDGATVVYRGGLWSGPFDSRFHAELYRVPLDGSAPSVRLHPATPADRTVYDFEIDHEGLRVAFLADLGALDVVELHGVSLAGGTPLVLNAPLPQGGDVVRNDVSGAGFAIAPGGRVLYLADQEVDQSLGLWSVPIDASEPPTRLGAPLRAHVREYGTRALAPDGASVVYRSDEEVDGAVELFAARLDGTAAWKLSGPLAGGEVTGDVTALRPVADGRVLYLAEQESEGATGLFSARKGHEPVTLGPVGALREVTAFDVTPDGARAVWIEDVVAPSAGRVYSRDVGAEEPGVLLASAASRIRSLRVTPDGATAFFLVGNTSSPALFAAALDGSAPAIQLSPSVRHDVPVCSSPDGAALVFFGDAEGRGTDDIYAVACDGSASPVQLNAHVPVGELGRAFEITPDGTRVLFTGEQGTGEMRLWISRIDASVSPIDLSGATVGDIGVPGGSPPKRSLQVTADSSRALFLADADSQGWGKLYTVKLDGSEAPERLLPAGETRHDFLLTPSGVRVLFVAEDSFQRFLYSMRSDGNGAPRILTPSSAFRDVPDFALTPNGQHVVYRSDQLSLGVFDLFSEASNGSSPSHDQLTFQGGVDVDLPVRIGPGGDRVWFVREGDLWSVPLDRRAPPERWSAVLPGESVRAFEPSADGSFAALIAPQDEPGVDELYQTGGRPIRQRPR